VWLECSCFSIHYTKFPAKPFCLARESWGLLWQSLPNCHWFGYKLLCSVRWAWHGQCCRLLCNTKWFPESGCLSKWHSTSCGHCWTPKHGVVCKSRPCSASSRVTACCCHRRSLNTGIHSRGPSRPEHIHQDYLHCTLSFHSPKCRWLYGTVLVRTCILLCSYTQGHYCLPFLTVTWT